VDGSALLSEVLSGLLAVLRDECLDRDCRYMASTFVLPVALLGLCKVFEVLSRSKVLRVYVVDVSLAVAAAASSSMSVSRC